MNGNTSCTPTLATTAASTPAASTPATSTPAPSTPRWRAADFGVAQAQVRGEDAFNQKRVSIGGEQLFMTMVADGDKTKLVSRHCSQAMLKLLETNMKRDPSPPSIEGACRKSFDQIHTHVVKEMTHRSGASSTLTVFVLNETRKEYVVANVGNSHAVSVRKDKMDLITSEQLFPGAPGAENKDETKPVTRLKPSKSRRAHMIGDPRVGSVAAPQPSVHSGRVPEDGLYVLIATDGFWEAMGSESTLRVLTSASSKTAASEIARKAVDTCKSTNRGTGHELDDILVIVVRFTPGSGAASAPAGGSKEKKQQGGCVVC